MIVAHSDGRSRLRWVFAALLVVVALGLVVVETGVAWYATESCDGTISRDCTLANRLIIAGYAMIFVWFMSGSAWISRRVSVRLVMPLFCVSLVAWVVLVKLLSQHD